MKMTRSVVVIIAILGIFCTNHVHCMTEAQLKNAIKLIRNMCQPKFKVTNAQIDNMHKGVFEDDQKLQCYMSCALHSLKFMKNGKMDYDYAVSQLKTLPPNYQEPSAKSINACKDHPLGDDKCDAAYELAKCIYNADPEHYFLP